jgi:hypothetical protein
MLTFLDRVWMQLGLQQEELVREKARGVVYAVLLLSGSMSFFLATDLVLNMTGRFG